MTGKYGVTRNDVISLLSMFVAPPSLTNLQRLARNNQISHSRRLFRLVSAWQLILADFATLNAVLGSPFPAPAPALYDGPSFAWTRMEVGRGKAALCRFANVLGGPEPIDVTTESFEEDDDGFSSGVTARSKRAAASVRDATNAANAETARLLMRASLLGSAVEDWLAVRTAEKKVSDASDEEAAPVKANRFAALEAL
eukprot:gnl/Ergobibamus_cyprinoides/1227.p1 GENE.gnl/Ergobibamus_cyprinoides/1227~~gnl/Ergobibamus_cyprinoides/1227.p1  ORF type:complete len:198 (+),score=83.61 gnl/Ergobibamus_cyprinoides/1227:89-682(+)